MKNYVIALDQGTTSSAPSSLTGSKTLWRSPKGVHPALSQSRLCGARPHGDLRLPVWRPHRGAGRGNIDPAEVAAIGITNQRETTILWDRKTGRPVYNAIVWQCRRTADICEDLKNRAWKSISVRTPAF